VSIDRSPLAMGLLGGAYRTARVGPGDIRADPPAWLRWFVDGAPSPQWLARAESVHGVLTSGGHTPAQGALAWLWARSPRTVPIPGVRTVAQAEQNADAMAHGPLTAEQLDEVAALLAAPA